MAKQAVVTADGASLPAYLTGYKGPQTNTMMESEDRIVPSVKLLQAISPELKAFNEAKEGVFWHSILNESLGSELRFITILARKSYVLFAPRGDERMILARSPDGKMWDRPNEDFEVKIKGLRKASDLVHERQRRGVATSGFWLVDTGRPTVTASGHARLRVLGVHARPPGLQPGPYSPEPLRHQARQGSELQDLAARRSGAAVRSNLQGGSD